MMILWKHLTVAYRRWFITFAMPTQYFNSKLAVAYRTTLACLSSSLSPLCFCWSNTDTIIRKFILRAPLTLRSRPQPSNSIDPRGEKRQQHSHSLFTLKSEHEHRLHSESMSLGISNITNRFHNALLVWNWIFSNIAAEQNVTEQVSLSLFSCWTIFFCSCSLQICQNRKRVLPSSPYDTFVFTVHRRRLRAVEGFGEIWWVLERSNDTKALGCMTVSGDSPR